MGEETYIEEGLAKIIKYDTTFYNPAQKTNRDISVLVINEYFSDKKNITILDAMSATGLRGIRYLHECSNVRVVFNDMSAESTKCIHDNLLRNDFDIAEISKCKIVDIKEKQERILLVNSDCNTLMCTVQNYFDVIDIDPFGSCSEYIENAFRSIRHNGIICFTSTDKGVLCTNESKCIVKYDTIILKKFSQNEMAIRALLSCISRHAAKLGICIEPILSLNLDFYVRVFVRVLKRTPKKVVDSNSLFHLCNCGYHEEIATGKLFKSVRISDMLPAFASAYNAIHPISHDEDMTDEFRKFIRAELADDIMLQTRNTCMVCRSNMKICGPFWKQKLHSENLIKKIINDNMDDRLRGILNYVMQEIDTCWYYEISILCKRLKLCCIKLKDMLTGLKNLGYEVSLTHCDINGFKTNAHLKVIILVMKARLLDINCKLFGKNEDIELLFMTNFHKGLINSGLGPLSLPK